MTKAMWALSGFFGWYLVLLNAVFLARGVAILRGKKINEFPAGVPHGGDGYWRLNRAHLNLAENLPLFAGVLLAGALLGAGGRWWELLPLVALGARVVQSLVHVSSGGEAAVTVRFLAFYTQLGCFAWLLVEIIRQKT
jgi:uncharacterized MAPEG superfamily protein